MIFGRHNLTAKDVGLFVAEEAPGYFGGFLNFGQMHCPVSSAHTRATLGWTPTHNTLLEDLALPHYFSKA